MSLSCFLQAAASGLWHQNLLLIASLTEVHGVFVAADPSAKTHYIEVKHFLPIFIVISIISNFLVMLNF